jgi:DNA-directed RNA polymerase specialized sigma24 family protein
MTQVPAEEFLRFVSNEIAPDDSDGTVNLLDDRAIAEYLEAQAAVEQQELRESVRQHFEAYLEKQVGTIATDWLRLYLQGRTQDEIAQTLEKPVKEIYRLREKVTYHATRVFAVKSESGLVANWLIGDTKS